MRMEYESGRFDAAAARASELCQTLPAAWRALYVTLAKRYDALAREGLQDGWSSIWNLDKK
jgi:adenylate cyclase